MTTTTFLTLEYLQEITPISDALAGQISILLPFTEVGEAMHIYDTLGTALKDDLITKIEAGTLAGNDLELVENYIIPASAWFCMFEASIFVIYQFTAKGVTKKFSDNSQAVDRQEAALVRQSILDKANFYSNRLTAYLEANQAKYPLYRGKPCGSQKTSFGGGIFLG